jgi:RNA polymerase sigma factor (TIGR02999 family)
MNQERTGASDRSPENSQRAQELLPLVYDELRRIASVQLAQEPQAQSLEATGLVHEAYLRLAGSVAFVNKSHFFRTAAEAMRRILIDRARQRRAAKRGGGARKLELAECDAVTLPDPETLLAVDEAISRLSSEDPQSAEIAKLRLFAGVSIEEAAKILGISRATAFRDWSFARAWLSAAIAPEKNEPNC